MWTNAGVLDLGRRFATAVVSVTAITLYSAIIIVIYRLSLLYVSAAAAPSTTSSSLSSSSFFFPCVIYVFCFTLELQLLLHVLYICRTLYSLSCACLLPPLFTPRTDTHTDTHIRTHTQSKSLIN